MFGLNKVLILVGLTFLLFLGSCKPEIDTDKHIAVAKELIAIQASYNRSYKSIFEQFYLQAELIEGNSSQLVEPNCVSVEVLPDSSQIFPITLNLDFGNECTLDESVYSGKVGATIQNFLNELENNIDFQFERFTLNQTALEADYSISYKGTNENELRVVEHQIQNGTLYNQENEQSSYSASIFATHFVGQTTDPIEQGIGAFEDDIWDLNYAGNFISANGSIYNFQSETDLTDRWTCDLPVNGRMVIAGADLQTDIIIDFGSGNCDQKVTIELDGEVSEWTIN